MAKSSPPTLGSHTDRRFPRNPVWIPCRDHRRGRLGICAAIKLRELGISCEIIEKNTDFGGTWHENRYPGAGVDTPNHLYSFSFAPHDWSRYFALQAELRDYFVGVANRYRLGEITRFGVGVERALWDSAANKWRLTTRGPGGSRRLRPTR